MMPHEELEEIKEQLLKQVESMPEPQKSQLKSQISSMNDEQLEQFLIQNKLIGESETGSKEKAQECIFCSIVQGKAPAYKIEENKSSMALLEINPLSKGHIIILSKNHNKLPSSAFSLANKLAKRVRKKLKADDVKIENVKILGHEIVQVIPLYKGQELKKTKADEKELILLQDKLKSKPRVKRKRQEKETVKILEKAPMRIP